MLEDLVKRHSLIWILLQKASDQVLGVGGDMTREVEPNVHDVPVGLLVGLRLEGWLAHQELIGEDAQGPVVHSLAVRMTLETDKLISPQSPRCPHLDHLRGQVVQCPAHGGPPAAGGVHGPPEVRDLEITSREKGTLRI